jgi:hypothetical protein
MVPTFLHGGVHEVLDYLCRPGRRAHRIDVLSSTLRPISASGRPLSRCQVARCKQTLRFFRQPLQAPTAIVTVTPSAHLSVERHRADLLEQLIQPSIGDCQIALENRAGPRMAPEQAAWFPLAEPATHRQDTRQCRS